MTVVAIDGPAGAGKSTVARAVAKRLGFTYLDSGAMYRSVALAALRAGVDLTDPTTTATLMADLRLEMSGDRVLLNGEDVSAAIRTEGGHVVSALSVSTPLVRMTPEREQEITQVVLETARAAALALRA